jgi:hypothetical protein
MGATSAPTFFLDIANCGTLYPAHKDPNTRHD